MTKKDYEAIAGAMKWLAPSTATPCDAETMWARVAFELADILAGDNARFDRKRFLTACCATVADRNNLESE